MGIFDDYYEAVGLRNKSRKRKPKGWKHEPIRHGLSAKGIRSGRKGIAVIGSIRIPQKPKFNFKKGDFFFNTKTGFVGIIEDNKANSKIRFTRTYGMAEEMGSVYAEDLEPITKEDFENRKTELFDTYGAVGQWSREESEIQKKKLKWTPEIEAEKQKKALSEPIPF
jgi:hypothetical protein